ncbi:Uncharacterised conserved protein UCP028704, OpgC [Rhabdaerophilaceae bacterium]
MDGATGKARAPRDVRLDVFRGLAMFIIFVAHVPDNTWFDWIPARFGFSSAAEIFVFCSGFASALAFGRIFLRNGFMAGLARILFRIWQVYWAHIGLALGMIVLSISAMKLTGIDYPSRIGMSWFYAEPGEGLFALMSLRFIPAYLDVLPMYLVLLAMIPLIMALGRIAPKLALAGVGALWLLVQLTGFNLSGGQGPGVLWYFNPFAWQLVFFTGFAFGMGWLPAPPLVRGRLFWLAVAALVFSVPLNFWGFTDNVPLLALWHDALIPANGKTNFNILLYLHFLAAAYVVLVLVEPYRASLYRLSLLVLVGQQALAAFLASILLAWASGMVLDAAGRDWATTALTNLAGFGALIGVAKLAQAYKAQKMAPPKPSMASPIGQPAE